MRVSACIGSQFEPSPGSTLEAITRNDPSASIFMFAASRDPVVSSLPVEP